MLVRSKQGSISFVAGCCWVNGVSKTSLRTEMHAHENQKDEQNRRELSAEPDGHLS
jgi:hypothetical protein